MSDIFYIFAIDFKLKVRCKNTKKNRVNNIK